jgi:hypothetical protein
MPEQVFNREMRLRLRGAAPHFFAERKKEPPKEVSFGIF